MFGDFLVVLSLPSEIGYSEIREESPKRWWAWRSNASYTWYLHTVFTERTNCISSESCKWNIGWKPWKNERWSSTCMWCCGMVLLFALLSYILLSLNLIFIIFFSLFLLFIFQRAACLLRKVVQEIERRVSTQSEHLRIVSCFIIVHLHLCVFLFLYRKNCSTLLL